MDPPLAFDVTKPIQNRCRQERLFDGEEATHRVSFGEEIKDCLGGQPESEWDGLVELAARTCRDARRASNRRGFP